MMAVPLTMALAGLAGLSGGTITGMLGLGGAALLPPLLGWWLHLGQHAAQGISLAAMLPPVGLPGIRAYRRHGVEIDWFVVGRLVIGFLLGVTLGSYLARWIPGPVLRRMFAAFLVIQAVRTFRMPTTVPAGDPPIVPIPGPTWFIGGLAGGLSGLLGVGGGVVAVPLLRSWAGYSRLQAQALTLAMMLPPIGLPAVLVYLQTDPNLTWPPMVAVGGAFAVGTGLGGLLAGRLSHKVADRLFAVLLLMMAVLLLVKGG
jgi:uncharacterized membrane protein YfcA